MVVTLRAITSLMTSWLWAEAGTKRATTRASQDTCGLASACQSRRINFNGFTVHTYIRSLVLPTQKFLSFRGSPFCATFVDSFRRQRIRHPDSEQSRAREQAASPAPWTACSRVRL